MHGPERSAFIGPEVAGAIDRIAALFEQAGVAYAEWEVRSAYSERGIASERCSCRCCSGCAGQP
jgi:hypothetical protein